MIRALGTTLAVLLLAGGAIGAAAPPAPEEVRRSMGVPSEGDRRGQQDAVGFAVTREQMDGIVRLAAAGPAPEGFGRTLRGPVLGALCPHDDYVYAGRMYRVALAPVRVKTVVLLGVFHKWRAFGIRDRLLFDTYRLWRSPDGDVPVSPLRKAVLERLSPGDFLEDGTAHDAEHSLEPIVFWLRHQNPEVEILPILVPTMDFDRMEALAGRLAAALSAALAERGLAWGRDVQVVVSSDAVHYGRDFDYTPFGDGGVEAYLLARAQDRRLVREYLSGKVTAQKARGLFGKLVDPKDPGRYRIPWCGRFSVPFAMLLLERLAGPGGVRAVPAATALSVDGPTLRFPQGPGPTAPADLHHFVGYAAVWFQSDPGPPAAR